MNNKKYQLYDLAKNDFKSGTRATKPLLTLTPSKITDPRRIGDSSIYVESNRSFNDIIGIIKCLIEKFNLSNDDFVFYTVDESYRQIAFELVKNLVINDYLTVEDIQALSTQEYTKTIIKGLKNPLIAYPSDLEAHEWKKERYSKECLVYDNIKIHVSNQFTKDALDELVSWHNTIIKK